MAKHKVIISCAVTGSIHTPSMSPHLPVTATEIAESALGAAEAGAAIVHLHARNPADGRPDQSPEAFEPFLKVIKQSSGVVVNLTTGGAPFMTIEERLRPAAHFKPEVASLNMGSMNFGLFPMLKRYKEFKYDWERPMLEASHDLVFRNSFKDIRYALETLNATGARYEFECYDTSHLYNLHHFLGEGLVKPPLFIQTCFGLLGGNHRVDRIVGRFRLLGRRRDLAKVTRGEVGWWDGANSTKAAAAYALLAASCLIPNPKWLPNTRWPWSAAVGFLRLGCLGGLGALVALVAVVAAASRREQRIRPGRTEPWRHHQFLHFVRFSFRSVGRFPSS